MKISSGNKNHPHGKDVCNVSKVSGGHRAPAASASASTVFFPKRGDNSLDSSSSSLLSVKEGALLRVPTPTTSHSTGKLWGFFKKSRPDPANLPTAPSETASPPGLEVGGGNPRHRLKKRLAHHKSTPHMKLRPEDLGKVDAFYAPAPSMMGPPPVPLKARTLNGQKPKSYDPASDNVRVHSARGTRGNEILSNGTNTPIYFTVDPTWDASRGDATPYFVPSGPSTSTSSSKYLDVPSDIPPSWSRRRQAKRCHSDASGPRLKHVGRLPEKPMPYSEDEIDAAYYFEESIFGGYSHRAQ